jgi:hypothetical protein
MTQTLLIWSITLLAGLLTAGTVWVVPDLVAKVLALRAARAARRKLEADAAALLDQAQDRQGGAA